jgi:hypothetical protein
MIMPEERREFRTVRTALREALTLYRMLHAHNKSRMEAYVLRGVVVNLSITERLEVVAKFR